jgi:hypothetical protein
MKRSVIVAIIVAAIAVPAGVYAASPLFINTMINEAVPVAGDDKIMVDKNDNTIIEKDNDTMADKGEGAMTNELAGSFAGAGDGIHNAEGAAKVIHVADGSDILRLENLKVTNGPDLYVYLATDNRASDYIDLGRLKANNGNQNYGIPEGTDLSKYDTVVVWCKQFSVLFGSAELTTMSA